MRIAVLCDIHGNLPALQAVLAEVEEAEVDLIVFGGDVAAGPMPVETIEVLVGYGGRARFVRGNADRLMVENFDGASKAEEAPVNWPATMLSRAHRDFLSSFEPAVEAAQRIMLRGLTASEADEFLRLLRKAIVAGNELSRAPLREAATEVASKD